MSLFETLMELKSEAEAAIKNAADGTMLEEVRIKYLGRSGALKDMMSRIKEVAKEEKGAFGKAMNDTKNDLTALFESQKDILGGVAATAAKPLYDPTLPGITREMGTLHPLRQTRDKIAGIFERMGFSIEDGPEIEDDFHNFEALNIPADHPARDDAETFGLEAGGLLRSQTSSVQIRTMEKVKPPVRIIAPGRVYRPDTVDATHHYAFHQLEGLAVDTNITFADLKAMLRMFAKEMFGEETQIRLRPSFFPFTEPSAEVDVTCIFCKGKGCKVCKGAGWIEVLGCGMVDPNVFNIVGYDAEKYTGFAFGIGIERVTMLTMGVTDIRRFLECDLRFLKQF